MNYAILGIIVMLVMPAWAILAPVFAVKCRDREIAKRKKAEEDAKDKNLNLLGFERRLSELYKEEFALADGNSYFTDPKTMDRVEEFAKNRKKINDLKERYPEYKSSYNDNRLCENAKKSYKNDLLCLQN